MARMFCCTLLVVAVSALALHAGDPPLGVADALSLQETLRQGRELLARGETAKAVDLLERQLTKIRGDAAFLTTLKEAYQTYVKELQLANKTETLEVYRKRLAVLERGSTPTVAPAANSPAVTPTNTPAPNPPAKPTAAPKREIARGARPEEDPFQQKPLIGGDTEVVSPADKAFEDRRYAEARTLYASAGALSAAQQSKYAYCLLHAVVERNNAGQGSPVDLQREVRAALALAPQDTQLAKFGQQLLQQLGDTGASGPIANGVIKHGEAGNGWKKAESTNFKLLHAQDPAYAEQFLRAAEQARSAAFAKWAGSTPGDWQPVCEICLHVNGASYAQATGQNATSPGHSSIKMPGGKVTSRRIDLRADNPDLGGVTLPHEITHVVLGDLFSDGSLPRWADEGMAVLSEPRTQVERYLKTMIRLRTEAKLIPLTQIVTKNEYPDAASVTVFYVESVSVVEFMVQQKGAAEFVHFMRDSKNSFEGALQQHYGYRTITQLEEAWRRATFTEVDRVAGVGGR